MAQHKSYTTYQPADAATFDINGTNFRLRPSIPGDVLLDFMSNMDSENTAGMVKVIRDLLDAAIAPEDHDRFKAFIREPSNNVSLNVLTEIAGFISERMSGNPTSPQPVPFTAG